MHQFTVACALALGLVFAATSANVAAAPIQAPAASAAATAAAAPKLHAAMRVLWHGHIVATRDYALAVHAGDKAAEQKASDAVVANAEQISDAVAGFYGKPAGGALLKLLGGHWDGVQALTGAAKHGNTAGQQTAMNELAGNATAIATFLAGINPNWTEGQLQGALMMHVNDHKTQIDEMMANAPKAEQAQSWDAMQQHMNLFADALTKGIATQFPHRAD